MSKQQHDNKSDLKSQGCKAYLAQGSEVFQRCFQAWLTVGCVTWFGLFSISTLWEKQAFSLVVDWRWSISLFSLQQALHGVEKLNFRQKLCSPGIIPLVKVGESFELGWVAAAVETLQGRKQKYMNPQLTKVCLRYTLACITNVKIWHSI